MSSHTLKTLLLLFTVATLTASGLTAQKPANELAGLMVFRPSTAVWHSRTQDDGGAYSAVHFGKSGDILVPADYDGDGQKDLAVWRPETATWHIQSGMNGETHSHFWGTATLSATGILPDVPVPADYDGDGKADIAVWRPEGGIWHLLLSSDEYDVNKAHFHYWGKPGDIPVSADYDGDGKADTAIFRPSENNWYIRESSTGSTVIRTFGSAGNDKLVPADYTGDGKADLAVYRGGTWYILDSSSGETTTFQMGFADSVPVPDDYDGDGVTDIAVYRGGTWYVYESGTPKFQSHIFGLAGDIPLAALRARPSITELP